MQELMNQLMQAALRYAELGYRVLPCAGKVPLTARGYHEASNDAATIRRWWMRWPEALIGIVADHVVIIDVDAADWPADEIERGSLLEAGAIAVTPRGGRHYYFRAPANASWHSTVGKLAPGVDTRCVNGYVIVPPSDGYYWAPDCELDREAQLLPEPPEWLVERLTVICSQRSSTNGSSANGISDSTSSNEANIITEGQRNARLFGMGCRLRRLGHSGEEIAALLITCNRKRCRPPLEDAEVVSIAESAMRYEADQEAQAEHEQWYHVAVSRYHRGGLPEVAFEDQWLRVPGLVESMLAYHQATAHRPQPRLMLGATLAALAACTPGWRDPHNTRSNVYIVGIAPTGAGKEHPRATIKQLLIAAGEEARLGPEGIASHAGVVSAVRQQPALLMQLDEIGRLLRATQSARLVPHLYHIVTVLMKLYTSSGGLYIGDAYADMAQCVRITEPHLCIYGTTTPEALFAGGISQDVFTEGLAGRVLLIEGDAMAERQSPAAMTLPSEAIEHVVRLCSAHAPVEVRVETAANAIYEAYDALADQRRHVLHRAGQHGAAAVLVRAGQHARKLGMLYVASQGTTRPVVTAEAARWAVSIADYWLTRWATIAIDHVGDDRLDILRRRVLAAIVAAGEAGLTRSQVCRMTQTISRREREDIMERLLTAGYVAIEHRRHGRKRIVAYVAASPIGE